MTILHLITSLQGGGTENFLYQILAHSPAGHRHQVVYLKRDGVIGDRIRALGVPVRQAAPFVSLYRILRAEKPDLLHTCLYTAHQVGRCIGRLAGVHPIVSSQRSIDIWQKPWQGRLDAWTLRFCDGVIANSPAARTLIEARRKGRLRPVVTHIPNGIDPAIFRPMARPEARRRYGLPPDAVVGGTLMRLHSEKGSDHIPGWAAPLLAHDPRLHLLIGGTGPLGNALRRQSQTLPHGDRLHWAGWEDTPSVFYSALDFFWSLSREESFPQTLLEASAMGLPWLAPDVGGVSELVQAGAAGLLFQRENLADARQKMITLLDRLDPRKEQAHGAAPKIQDAYSLQKMIARVYEALESFR